VADPPLSRLLFDLNRKDFFEPKGKKLKNSTFFVEIFPIQTETKDG